MPRIASGIALAMLFVVSAAADEFRPSTSIESVVVFPYGASITRSVPIDLPAGPSVVILEDLPYEIETDSITVDGKTGTRLEIGSVATRIVPADATKDAKRKAISDEIRRLEDQRADIADKIAALDGRNRFVEKMLETAPVGFGKALGEGTGGIEQWAAASKTLGEDLDQIATATRTLQRDDRALVEQIGDRTKALNELPPPSDRVEVRIELAAEAAAKGILTVGYRTPSAWWVPSYHALLSTGDGGGEASLQIVRRAEVTQSTGEDWSDVALTLSTARSAGGTAAPYLESSLAMIDPGYSTRTDGYGQYDKMIAPPAPQPTARAVYDSVGVPELAMESPAVPVEAVADFGDFRAEYKVPGKVTLATGIGARAFRVSTETGKPELEVRAVPILSSSSYLTARFTAPSSAPLLAGKVALFRDGAFVGQGQIPFVNGGTKVDLGFGVDDSVKVTRVAIDRAVAETGILTSKRTDTRRFRIKVENLHKQPIRITVLDRMPYSEDEKVVVVRLDDTTDPTVEDVDDRRGVLAWSYVYEQGESRDIQNAYTVTWPAGETVVLAD